MLPVPRRSLPSGSRLATWLLICLFVGAPNLAFGSGPPETVSPGSTGEIVAVGDRCPTFSWAAVEDADSLDLIVFEILSAGTEPELDESPVLRARVPGGATTWSPSLDRCLELDSGYAWMVRSRGEDGSSPWSRIRLFRTPASPDPSELEAALGIVRQALASGALRSREGAAREERSGTEDPVRDSVERAGAAAVASLDAAIQGTGEIGALGTSVSSTGVGLAARNTAGGADLLLDGVEDGQTDTLLSQEGVDRPSAGLETFDFTNSGGGGFSLRVDGVDVSLSDHLHDDRYFTETELSASGAGGSVHWDNLSSVPSDLSDGDDDTTYGAGTGLLLSGGQYSVDDSLVALKTGADQDFDGGLLHLDYTNDRVGILETSPGSALEVAGTVEADGLAYRAATPWTHPVPVYGFRHTTPSVPWEIAGGTLTYTGTGSGYDSYAEVHLPDGVDVTGLTCFARDTDASNDAQWTYKLLRDSYAAQGAGIMAQVTIDSTGSSTTILSGTDTTIDQNPIDNASNRYAVKLEYVRDFGPENTPTLRTFGCRIDYEMTTLGSP